MGINVVDHKGATKTSAVAKMLLVLYDSMLVISMRVQPTKATHKFKVFKYEAEG